MGSPLPKDFLPQDAYFAISQIVECTHEHEVAALTKTIVHALGAQSYVYSTMVANDRPEERESFRFFIGCDPRWCHIYNQRKWFMNDPFVEYSRNNHKEIFGTQIPVYTEGQKEMLRVGAMYGFRCGLVVPTHSNTNADERLGMLYIGSNDDPEIGEPILKQNRVLFRSLAMELLDWWINRLQQDAAKKYKLTAEEIQILQMQKNGLTVLEISARQNIHEKTLYRRIGVIKDKLNADSPQEAIKLATYACLLT